MDKTKQNLSNEHARDQSDNRSVAGLTTRSDNYEAFKRLLQQTQRTLTIFSHNLDAQLYNTDEIMALIQRLALHNKHANIKILLKDCQQLAQNGHQIIELARRLTSKIQIYQLAKDFTEYHECFIIADTNQIIFRPHADRFEGTVSHHDPLQVRTKLALFEQAWALSEPSAEMRRLHL
ncbi:MAG: hypothetical protein OEY89_02280 [Gammaproteobacteria bacterium]|nr:hypothetical protein [Gammaproteobacteria bacterium]